MKNEILSSHEEKLLSLKYKAMGFCAGVDFPGDTIRKCLNSLEKKGFLDSDLKVTSKGVEFLKANHLRLI